MVDEIQEWTIEETRNGVNCTNQRGLWAENSAKIIRLIEPIQLVPGVYECKICGGLHPGQTVTSRSFSHNCVHIGYRFSLSAEGLYLWSGHFTTFHVVSDSNERLRYRWRNNFYFPSFINWACYSMAISVKKEFSKKFDLN